MKIHCLFEQSGTFKNEFKKLGYEAYDYDILNDYGQTDYQIDLFEEIHSAYSGGVRYLTHLVKRILYLLSSPAHISKVITQRGFSLSHLIVGI